MPIYTVQDSTTNKTIKFDWSGSQPPTDADMESVFAEAKSPTNRSFWGKVADFSRTPDKTGITSGLAAIGAPLEEMRQIPPRLVAQGVKAAQGGQVSGQDVKNIITSPYTDAGKNKPILSDVVANPESKVSQYAKKTGNYTPAIAQKAVGYLIDPFLDPLTYLGGELLNVGGRAAIAGVKAIAGKAVGKTLTMAEVGALEDAGKQAPSWWQKFTPKDKNEIIGAIQKDGKVTVAVRERGMQPAIPTAQAAPETIIKPEVVSTPQPTGIKPEIGYHATDTVIKGDVLKSGTPSPKNYFGEGVYVTNKEGLYPGAKTYQVPIPQGLKTLDLTGEGIGNKFVSQVAQRVGVPVEKSGMGVFEDLRLLAEKSSDVKVRAAVNDLTKGYEAIKSPLAYDGQFETVIRKPFVNLKSTPTLNPLAGDVEAYGSISPTSNGKFTAYDPIRQERLYVKGKGTTIKYFDTEKEAQTALDKLRDSRLSNPLTNQAGKVKILSDEEAKKLAPTGISAELQPLINADNVNWQKVNTFLKRKGYDVRGADDTKNIYSRMTEGFTKPLKLTGDHSAALEYAKPIEQTVETKAARYFGLTNDTNKAGYLTPEGKLLDLSGRKQGNDFATSRALDHREINFVLPENNPILNKLETDNPGSNSSGMRFFMDRGNIRLQSNGFDLMKEPTNKQWSVLRGHIEKNKGESFFVDISNIKGNTLANFSYEYPDISGQKVINDVNRFFKYGIKPRGFDYGRVKILSNDEAEALAAKGVQFQSGAAALGRLNPDTFSPKVQPVLNEAIAKNPTVTPPITDNTIRGMAASLKSRPLTEAILRKPEGQLAAEVMSQRQELTQNILGIKSESLKGLAADLDIVNKQAVDYAKPGTEMGRAFRMRKVDPQVNNQIWNKINDLRARVKAVKDDPTVDPDLKRRVLEGLLANEKLLTDPAVNPTLANKIYYAWLNAILSNPMTHVRNTVGNLMFAADKVLETIPKVPIDILRAGVTKGGQRTAWWGEIPAMVRGALSKEKLPQEIMGLAKGTKIERGAPIPGMAGKIIGTPTNFLQTEDSIFKNLVGRMEMYRMRFLEGKGKFTSGKDVLAQQVADEMLYRTFQNDPAIAAEGLMKLRSKVPGVEYVIPFIKTPANLTNVAIERSPLQAINILIKATKLKKYVGNQAEVSRDLARLTTGSAIAAWVALKYYQGKMTASAPGTPAKRDAFYREGKKPNSVLVGKTWIPLGNLDPLGGVVTMVTNTINRWEQTGAKTDDPAVIDKALNIGYGIMQLISTRTYLSGIVNLSSAMSDPERYAKQLFKTQVASVVPGGLKFFADLVDNNYRETNSQLAVIVNKIPFLSKKLPERVNLLGESQAGRTLGVTGAGKAIDNEFNSRVKGINIGGTSKALGDTKMNAEQLRWVYKTSGEWIKEDIMAYSPEEWTGMTMEDKQDAVSRIVNAARKEARQQIKDSMGG